MPAVSTMKRSWIRTAMVYEWHRWRIN